MPAQNKDVLMSNKPQCVGIDFGTFKTSIVAQMEIDSIMTAVGLPKDHIARGMLGCDEVFGDRIGQVRQPSISSALLTVGP